MQPVSKIALLFGASSNNALNSTRNALKNINYSNTKFGLPIFASVTLSGRTFTATKGDIELWLENYEKGQSTYILLSLLYPNYKLSQVAFHQDHCHPYVGFDHKQTKNLPIPENVIDDWRTKRNLIPNLQFLESRENESKKQNTAGRLVGRRPYY